MELGIVGLGKMGGNMAERLVQHGHRVVGSDLGQAPRERLVGLGGEGVSTVTELVRHLTQTPKVVWSMVAAGHVTDSVIGEAAAALDHFLEDFYNSFQQRYGIQLYRYYRAIDERAGRHHPVPSAPSPAQDPPF